MNRRYNLAIPQHRHRTVEEAAKVVTEVTPTPVKEIATTVASSREINQFEVSRHIRNLPNGWHASPEKVAEALKNNIVLGEGQTWVNSYMKGGAAA